MKRDEVTVRLATPEDAPSFAKWATENPDIPNSDIKAVGDSEPLVIVIEVGGKPEMYLPLIPAMTIGYLGFRPGQDVRTRAVCLKNMLAALKRLQSDLKIQYAYVHTKADYPLGKWATKNGFERAPKDAFILERQ